MILLIASKQRVEPSAVPASRDFSSEPLAQLRPPPPPRHVTHRNSDSLFLSDQYDQMLAARNAGVEEVPLQHGIVLRQDRNHHRRIFGALALMNGCRISRYQHVEFAKSIGHGPTVKGSGELARGSVDIVDGADIAVINLLVVVVLDLHDLVARGKGPAEPFDFTVARGV